jgi:hypothetical protein
MHVLLECGCILGVKSYISSGSLILVDDIQLNLVLLCCHNQ